MDFAVDRVRARLLGGTLSSRELLVACLRVRVWCEGASASSSPDASRDKGCCRSAAADGSRSDALDRFLFAELGEDGDDMNVGNATVVADGERIGEQLRWVVIRMVLCEHKDAVPES